jgi:hypothetical protein
MTKDIDYTEIDPGIRGMVAALRLNGFETTDSGDGVTKADMPCSLPYPHVFITTTKEQLLAEADRLYSFVNAEYIESNMPSGWKVEACYSPNDDASILVVYSL